MYYNRNLITAAKHEVTALDGSGVFDLQAQSVFKSQDIWPGLVTSDFAYVINNAGAAFNLRSNNYGTATYSINWGDGSSLSSTTDDNLTHTYSTSGTYTIKLDISSGSYRPYFYGSTTKAQVTSVSVGASSATLSNDLRRAFEGLVNMTSYSQVADATSSSTNLYQAWKDCQSLSSFPSIDVSSASNFINTWQGCISLTTFPANQFDSTGSISSGSFSSAWNNCALTAQSIENILTSLVTNGATGITLGMSGGTNAAYSTWSSAAQTALTTLQSRSWNVTYNT